MRNSNERSAASSMSGARRMTPYAKLRSLLLAYLSPILVDTVLNRAMLKHELSPHSLTSDEIRELAPDMMLGLRLFVAEKRLPDLMVELAEIIEEDAS